jgi:molecular chaperone DnaJ
MSKDYYSILGVDKGADEKEIKKSYRKLSKQYHPDVNPDDKTAEEKFKEIADAYSVLSDPQKKSNYDQFGSADGNPYGGGDPFSGGGMGDIFDQFFGGGQRRSQFRKPRGRDLRVTLHLTLEEIYSGVEKKIKYKHMKKCGSCDGEGGETHICNQCNGSGTVSQIINTPIGRMRQDVECPTCSGKGKILKSTCGVCNGKGGEIVEENLDITIPKGVHDGQMMQSRGGGDFIRGGVAGDLIVQIVETPHEKFVRNGDDLLHKLKIPYHTLVLGGPMEVETIDGKIRINIKEGTEIGENLRVPGKGLYNTNNPHKGDLIIETWLEVPKKISKEHREKVENLKEVDYNYEELK